MDEIIDKLLTTIDTEAQVLDVSSLGPKAVIYGVTRVGQDIPTWVVRDEDGDTLGVGLSRAEAIVDAAITCINRLTGEHRRLYDAVHRHAQSRREMDRLLGITD